MSRRRRTGWHNSRLVLFLRELCQCGLWQRQSPIMSWGQSFGLAAALGNFEDAQPALVLLRFFRPQKAAQTFAILVCYSVVRNHKGHPAIRPCVFFVRCCRLRCLAPCQPCHKKVRLVAHTATQERRLWLLLGALSVWRLSDRKLLIRTSCYLG